MDPDERAVRRQQLLSKLSRRRSGQEQQQQQQQQHPSSPSPSAASLRRNNPPAPPSSSSSSLPLAAAPRQQHDVQLSSPLHPPLVLSPAPAPVAEPPSPRQQHNVQNPPLPESPLPSPPVLPNHQLMAMSPPNDSANEARPASPSSWLAILSHIHPPAQLPSVFVPRTSYHFNIYNNHSPSQQPRPGDSNLPTTTHVHAHAHWLPPLLADRWFLALVVLFFAYWVYNRPFVGEWLMGLVHGMGWVLNHTVRAVGVVDALMIKADCISRTWSVSHCLFGASWKEGMVAAGESMAGVATSVYAATSLPSISHLWQAESVARAVPPVIETAVHNESIFTKINFNPDMVTIPYAISEFRAQVKGVARTTETSSLRSKEVIVAQLMKVDGSLHHINDGFGHWETTLFSAINQIIIASRNCGGLSMRLSSQYEARERRSLVTMVTSSLSLVIFGEIDLDRRLREVTLSHSILISQESQRVVLAGTAFIKDLDILLQHLINAIQAAETAHQDVRVEYTKYNDRVLWKWFGIGDKTHLESLSSNGVDLQTTIAVVKTIRQYVSEHVLWMEGVVATFQDLRLQAQDRHTAWLDKTQSFGVRAQQLLWYAKAKLHTANTLNQKVELRGEFEREYIKRLRVAAVGEGGL